MAVRNGQVRTGHCGESRREVQTAPDVYGGLVTDASPPAGGPLEDPFASLTGPLAGASRWELTVVAARDLRPHLLRVEFTAPGLDTLAYQPGQDLMLLVAVEGNRPVRRRYTIRSLDRTTSLLSIDVVRHGDGPGERWMQDARPGVTVEAIAPRGKISPVSDVDWHLFVGDESALPAFTVMTESLPAGTPAMMVVEIPEPADELPVDATATVTTHWLPRDGRAAGDAEELVRAASTVALPDGRGHAYLAGEARVVSALRDTLAARGIGDEDVSPKAYWGRGRANADHGEPAKA